MINILIGIIGKLQRSVVSTLVRRYNGTVERFSKYEKVEFDRIIVCFFCTQMLHVQSSMRDYTLSEN